MDEFTRAASLERRARRTGRQRIFWLHVVVWAAVNLLLVVVWLVTGAQFPWFVFPMFGWLVLLAAHGAAAYVLQDPADAIVGREVTRRGRSRG